VIDATTTDPKLTRELGEAFAARGIIYLDCPVFGSKDEAWEGRLDFVCGGPQVPFDRVRPLLEPLAATIHYMGESGAGAAMKLVGNLFVAAQLSSIGEGLSLARKAGLDPQAVMGVLDVTDYSSPLIRGVGRNSFAGNYEPYFYLKHMLKDARLIEDFARQLAVPVPATATVAELLQAAVNAGYGELNASALHKLMSRLAGVER
jgi:3-hydroxyisobutyrate dehydrogenase-like beta-hydroxyacid dehydrogenase